MFRKPSVNNIVAMIAEYSVDELEDMKMAIEEELEQRDPNEEPEFTPVTGPPSPNSQMIIDSMWKRMQRESESE